MSLRWTVSNCSGNESRREKIGLDQTRGGGFSKKELMVLGIAYGIYLIFVAYVLYFSQLFTLKLVPFLLIPALGGEVYILKRTPRHRKSHLARVIMLSATIVIV